MHTTAGDRPSQPRVRIGHHKDALEQIRDQLDQSRKTAPQQVEQPPVSTPIQDNKLSLETLMAYGVDEDLARKALHQFKSVTQAATWLRENQLREEIGRSSEFPIASNTSLDSGYQTPSTSLARSRTTLPSTSPRAPISAQSSHRDVYYREVNEPSTVNYPGYSMYNHSRVTDDSPVLRNESPATSAYNSQQNNMLSQHHQQSPAYRCPSPGSSSPRQVPTPVAQTDLKRSHKLRSSPRTDTSSANSHPQMSMVSIQKMNERNSANSSVRSSPREEFRDSSENGIPVSKAQLPAGSQKISINVNHTNGCRNLHARISSAEDNYLNGNPSVASMHPIIGNGDHTVLNNISYLDKMIMQPSTAAEVNTDRYIARMLPSTSAPSTSSHHSITYLPSKYMDVQAPYSQPYGSSTQVMIGGGQPRMMGGAHVYPSSSMPTAALPHIPTASNGSSASHSSHVAALPTPARNDEQRKPRLTQTRSRDGVVRSLSPLPQVVRVKLREGKYEKGIEPCQPRIFRFFMEQHLERLMEQQRGREKRAEQMRKDMDEVHLEGAVKEQLLDYLMQKESKYMRLKRQKLDKDMFEHIRHIGVGAFGRVSLVRKIDTGHAYAMKRLLKKDVISKNQTAHVRAERDILAEADSEWIVRLYFSFQDERCLYFIMEYVPGGDMMELLIKKGWFEEEMARFYIAELTCAIEYVHSMGFIHRDIKPDNILIDHKGHLKLTDFGLCTGLRWTHDKKYYGPENDEQPGEHYRQDSFTIPKDAKILEARQRRKRDQAHSLVGTTSYMAPEVVLTTGHTQLCDWWSVGVILYEMVYGRAPFTSECDDEEIKLKIVNFRSELRLYQRVPVPGGYNTLSDQCISMIKDLVRDESDRLGRINGAADVKRHAWLKDINFATLRESEAAWKPTITHREDTSNFEPLELADFNFDSMRVPANNPAFCEFTFRHFFEIEPDGSLSLRRRHTALPRHPNSRPPIPFEVTASSSSSVPPPLPSSKPPSFHHAPPPPYFSHHNILPNTREASDESIDI